MMWKREVFSYLKWLASKLGSSTFGDKQKQEIKQDSTLTISWGRPKHDEQNSIENKKMDKQLQNETFNRLPGTG